MPACDTGPVSSSVVWAGLGSGWGPRNNAPGVLSQPGHELLGQAGTSLILCPNLDVDTHLVGLQRGMGELICIICCLPAASINNNCVSQQYQPHCHGSVPFAPTA